jgi:hypothetical protein
LSCRVCKGTVVVGQKCRYSKCSTHLSEVAVFWKKTGPFILSVPKLYHNAILEPCFLPGSQHLSQLLWPAMSAASCPKFLSEISD